MPRKRSTSTASGADEPASTAFQLTVRATHFYMLSSFNRSTPMRKAVLNGVRLSLLG